MSLKFNGLRLRDLREAYNLSRKDLADRINVSEQAVGQFENGSIIPKFETINLLKKEFAVNLSYFQRDTVVNKVVSSNRIAYRSDVKKSMKTTEKETTFLNVINDFLDYVMTGVSVPDYQLIDLRQQALVEYEKGNSISKIADNARYFLNLDKYNSNLMAAIENSGAYVLERSLNDYVDAYSTWTDENRAFIILGMNKSSSRRNFDLAHEFGHLLLHYQVDLSDEKSEEYKQAEKEANSFASSFLLEEATFVYMFKKYVKNPADPDSYLPLKKCFKVSIQTLEMRAASLNLITKQEISYFWGRLNKKGYKYIEPLDGELPLSIPGKIQAILVAKYGRKLKPLFEDYGIQKAFLKKLILRDDLPTTVNTHNREYTSNSIRSIYG